MSKTPATSEEVFQLVEQPGPTCPMIDRAINLICLELHCDISQNDLVDDLVQELEKIRSNAEDIRRWGQDWKDEAIRAHQSHNTDEYARYLELKSENCDFD